MAEYTDITALMAKQANEEARQDIVDNEVADDEYLAADQWNTLVGAVRQLQQRDAQSVKSITFKGTTYPPQEGIAVIPSDGIAALCFSPSVDANNHYHLWGFASAADMQLYRTAPVAHASKLLIDAELNISTVQSDSYVARLFCDHSTTTNYIIKDGTAFTVNLRYSAIHIIAALNESENMGGKGTLIIERSTDGGVTFERVGTANPDSVNADVATYPFALDLSPYLQTGTANVIRLRAQFQYTDENNQLQTRTSSNIDLSIQSVTLSLSMATDWRSPIQGAGRGNIPLSFDIRGRVQKTLHVSVSGTGGGYQDFTVTYGSTQEGPVEVNIPDAQGTYGLLSHGVHVVEAWLTADDGQGGTLRSETATNQVMVVNAGTEGADLTKAYLLIQNLRESVPNFVQSTICQYAVFAPRQNADGTITNGGDAVRVAFVLTNSNESILTKAQTEYFRSEKTVAPNSEDTALEVSVEIEQEQGEQAADGFDTFLHAIRIADDGTPADFLLESVGSGAMYMEVDNTGGFQPTAGSTFLLNPKVRNNGEANPLRILNARNGNAEVESVWTGFKLGEVDGWITAEDGQKVLRVNAGSQLQIKFNPFAQFVNAPSSAMTLDIDMAVRNITNEDDPILRISEQINGLTCGLTLQPIHGKLSTATSQADKATTFDWQEDERVHVSINILPNVQPNVGGDGLAYGEYASKANGTIALARVFINGDLQREVRFSKASDAVEWCTGAMSNGGIVIGQDGADIDIYGIRCWTEKTLSARQVVQDYVSTLPTSEEKREVKRQNDICNADGRISVAKVRALGKNVLVWHGLEVYKGLDKATGWYEIFRYDEQGNYLPELSGTLCKETRSLAIKAQGTTAKTYYYHNIQDKQSDVEATIAVKLSLLHSEISYRVDASYEWTDEEDTPTGETGCVWLRGGCLGKNFPSRNEKEVAYPLTTLEGEQAVVVPDGWVDGNGKYRGLGYRVAEGLPMAQKKVLKINYASSMQSHLIGVNWLYNDLHTLYVGKNALQQAVEGAVVAKHTEPFLFFTQGDGDTEPVYRGPGAYGPGKMDKPTWGYVKSEYPNFTMIEGADNNKTLTDMRCPWDDVAHGDDPAKVYYDPKEEAWMFRNKDGVEKCVNFDTGATDKVDGKEYPKEQVVKYVRAAWNFLYLHHPRINVYRGAFSEFESLVGTGGLATHTADQAKKEKWWCKSNAGTDSEDYKLKRWDYAEQRWVDAGLWNGAAYDVIDLRTYTLTKAVWDGKSAAQRAELDTLNAEWKAAIVADARANIGTYFVVDSLKFHYCFENHFMAGTDNCSKNTYYVLVPVSDGIADSPTWKFELHQDDVDTVLATDNDGLQTKPYYIDRVHPRPTGSEESCYEGGDNVLFNLVEEMWDATGELATAMNDILRLMATLADSRAGTSQSKGLTGVWGTLNKYLFDIQRYIPQMAYNEAARIRYEFPAMIGYLSENRAIDPIQQSMGSQLECELQYMKRRLVYMASYAAFGEFRNMNTRNGLTGLGEASATFSMKHLALPDGSGPSYTFRVVPHQWIYPTFGVDNDTRDPHLRVAPGETLTYTINTQAGDNGVVLYGVNFYRSLGNVGDMGTDASQEFTLNGTRLVEFVAEPTKTYTDRTTGEELPAFRVSGFKIGSATRLRRLSLRGAVLGGGLLNASALTRLEELDVRQTDVANVTLPRSEVLETVRMPDTLTTLRVENVPNLSALTLEGSARLQTLVIADAPKVLSRDVAQQVYEDKAGAALSEVRIEGIAWTDLTADVMMWLAGAGSATLKGRIVMAPNSSDRYLTFDEVVTLVGLFGNIQSTANSLYVNYPKRDINTFSVAGVKYVKDTGTFDGWRLVIQPSSGNNVAIATDADGVAHEDVTWAFTGDNAASVGQYAEWEDNVKGILTVKRLSSPSLNFTLRVSIGLVDGTTLTFDKKVGFYNRIPVVGDFAYLDGTFDDEYDMSKTLAGMVVKRDELTEDGTTTGYRLWVCGKEDARLTSTDLAYNATQHVWGIYPQDTGAQGFPTSVCYEITEKAGLGSAVDTAMVNIGTSGIPNADGTATTYNYIDDTGRYLDANQDDGYGVLATGGAASDFATKEKNAVLLAHAQAVISGYLDEDWPKTRTELADAMTALVAKMKADGVSAPERYRQLYYPAAYACYLYEMGAKEGETVADAYQRGQWMLPSAGLLCRIYNFYHNSRGRITGTSPNAGYADESPASEALLPLFANMLARILAVAGAANPFSMPVNGGYWSCTEHGQFYAWYVGFGSGGVSGGGKCSSVYVRPVAAFTFNL